MFDIAWSELMVIAVVAVVVVGPKDLPKMMRAAGQWMGRARAMADQFRRSFDDMARQSELEELRAEVMKMHNEKSLAQIQHETEIMMGNIPPDSPFTGHEIQKPAEVPHVDSDPELDADAELAGSDNEPMNPAERSISPPHRDEP